MLLLLLIYMYITLVLQSDTTFMISVFNATTLVHFHIILKILSPCPYTYAAYFTKWFALFWKKGVYCFGRGRSVGLLFDRSVERISTVSR